MSNRNLRRTRRGLVAAGLVTVPEEGRLRVDDAPALAQAAHLRWPNEWPERPLI